MALSLGVTPDKIIFAHTTKPMSHIKYACAHGVDVMTFDSEDELLKILVLRIAVDDSESLIQLSSKFGAQLASVGSWRAGFEISGFSFTRQSACHRRLFQTGHRRCPTRL
ncbi:hypothetical protein FQN60_006706 [Etheostoma spectabile]|uniref:Orn/DAP/Arg decarboxylase 2 N-terminal domain-containing protein n=1 Tax=Etheostoma spectabile TaxID=54343 RepID=A0A5J5CF31_9PERO|nr:hypothetical protein FQN60_006706 [Etheostoma spectabile]